MSDFLARIRNETIKLKETDKLYDVKHGNMEIESLLKDRPYRTVPKFFKKVRISLMALIKMLNHAQMGGNIEVMGHFMGYYTRAGEFIVLDSVALPVEATETTVNAGQAADNFTIQFSELGEKLGNFPFIGWYHSHPNYGCWLSGTDVFTQANYQMSPDPWLAIVIDPIQTITRERLSIGAFRTYPLNYVPPEELNANDEPDVPMKKIAEFGASYKRYYSLEVELFQNDLDNNIIESLWKKYWMSHLSSSPFYGNINYYQQNIEEVCGCSRDLCKREFVFIVEQKDKQKGFNLKKVLNKTIERNQAIMGEAIKNTLF